jgi:uncharacterized protein (DUF58 family)
VSQPAGPGGTHPGGVPASPGWVPTRALGRAIFFASVLLLTAALTGRLDLVVLAAPFALGTAVSLRRRPVRVPTVELSTVDRPVGEGHRATATIRVVNPDPVGYDLALVRLGLPRWVRLRHGDRPYAAPVAGGQVADVELAGPAVRWGRHHIGPAVAYALACGGLLVSEEAVAGAVRLKVYPTTEPFDADDAMPRAAGLVGQHRSRRPGEGGELAGVREFAPGDRLRRVDWRVTLRTQRLHVASTLSDRDAEVVLLLDVLHEAGESTGIGGTASVLDVTVRAAAGIAEHYLHRGDRVSMLEYGHLARRLRPASGRRQYVTVLEWLLDVRPARGSYEPTGGAFGTHPLPAHALVVVLTPLLDPWSAQMLARLARAGRFVIAVDTLTPEVRPRPTVSDWWAVAYRLWRLDRDNTIGQLREHGVPVVTWAGPGSLDLVLRDVSRLATAPKVVRR